MKIRKCENERDHLLNKVELAESEAAKRSKEVDAKEAERVETHNQFKKILTMIEDRVSFFDGHTLSFKGTWSLSVIKFACFVSAS